MVNLPGYQETNQIYPRKRTLVYRAIREQEGCRVIIKVLRNPFPRFNDLICFRKQYFITRHLEHPIIVRPLALERYSNSYALVMPDERTIALFKYWPNFSQNLIDSTNPSSSNGDISSRANSTKFNPNISFSSRQN